ncbi:DUF4232 domain-containing protein [Streptomyces sp. NBC_00388]|uniref:DUF4232 domain-containing protein n=1 Tax=Streptomyces sp. NBC_00388 TaxID=2975735 RepID=UPI002E1B7062
MPKPGQQGGQDRMTGTGGRAAPGARRGLVAGAATAAVAGALLLTGCGSGDTGPQKVVSAGGPVVSGASAAEPGGGKDATPSSAPQGNGTDTPASSGGGKSSGTGGATPPGKGGSSAGGTGGGPTPAPAASTRCHTSELRLSVGGEDPGAGQENFPLVVTNTSSHTCTVSGFPGLAFVDSSGRQVSVNPERTGSSGSPVKLAPGASAWAPLSYANPDVSGSGEVTPPTVRVTPPDEKVALIVPWDGGPVPDGKTSAPRVGSFSAGSG